MAAIFISHSSEDTLQATQVAAALRARGFQHLFLDFDSAQGIPGGSRWEHELYRQLRQCQAVIVLCSPDAMASDWVFAEITHARAQGKPLIPLEIAPCTPRSILSDTQIIRPESLQVEGLHTLWTALQAAGLDPADVHQWQGTRSPYPGLAAFDEADAAVFFGRDADVREGLDTLNRLRRFGGARLALFLGPSGSGKSSLVRAGILPKLRRSPDWLVAPPMRPGRQPMDALAVALSRCYEALGVVRPADQIRDGLTGTGPGSALGELAENLLSRAERPAASLMLVIDQLEELLDPDHTAQSDALLDLLIPEIDRAQTRLLLVATMRSDFLTELQRHPRLQSVAHRDIPVRALSIDDFAQVISEPARVAGIELENGLVDRILQDTATEQALPLLAYALRALWEQYGHDDRLTIDEYENGLGGLAGSIRRAADNLLADCNPSPETLTALRDAFRGLVRLNEDGQYARRTTHWQELPTASHEILHRFVDHRLMVSGEAENSLEVAHEALFRVWPRLRAWLDEDREFLLWRRRLQGGVEAWQHSQAPLRDAPLIEAEHWLQTRSTDLDDQERALVDHSIRLRDEEAARNRRRRRTAMGGLITGLLIVTTLLAVSVYQYRLVTRSEAATRAQLARTHWVTGVRSRDDQDERIKAGHHFARSAELLSEAPSGLSALMAVDFISHEIRLERILEPEGGLQGVATTPDFGHIALWGDDDRIDVWSAGIEEPKRLPHADVEGAGFFADGQMMSWGADGVVWIWDVEQGTRIRQLPHGDGLRGAQVGPASGRVLTWSTSGVVRLWDRTATRPLAEYTHDGRVNRARLHAAGKRVVSWSNDRTVRALTDGDPTSTDTWLHPDVVLHAEPDPRSNDVLSVAADGRVRLWTPGAPNPVFALDTDTGVPLDGATFVGASSRILTWDLEGALRLWREDGGGIAAAFGHGSTLRRVVTHDATRQIATCGQDGRVVLWSADGDRLRVLWHKGPVRGAAFSRDGARLLTWSEDHRARLWDTRNGQLQGFPMVHQDSVKQAQLGDDETGILTWSAGGSIRLWRMDARDTVQRTIQHGAPIVTIAGSARDGRLHSLTSAGHLRSWPSHDPADSKTVSLEDAPTASIQGGLIMAEGQRVVGWNRGGIWVWPLPGGTGQRTGRIATGPTEMEGAAVNRDGHHLLTWGNDGYAQVVDSRSEFLPVRLAHGQPVIQGAVSADGDWALTAGARFQVHTWRTGEPTPVATFTVPGVQAMGIRADNRLAFATGGAGRIELWDPRGGVSRTPIRHGSSVTGAAFSPDGVSLVSWDRDGSIRLWNADDGSERVPPFEHGPDLTTVAFSPDGRRLISWGQRAARVWSAADGYALTPRLLHEETIRGATLVSERPQAVIWGTRIARVWPLPSEEVSERHDVAVRQQVLSGTRLSQSGEIQILGAEQWLSLKRSVTGGS